MITLVEILAGKEARYKRQQDFREKYKTTLVSITINMPGPVKDLPILRRLRDYALQEIKKQLHVVGAEEGNFCTGPVALVAVTDSGSEAKRISIRIEEEVSFARLLDIDIFAADGQLLSRQDQGKGRGCFVCGAETVVCMREQKHTQEGLQVAVERMLNEFRAYESRLLSPAAEELGALAVEAMLYEATCTPAPGLVDRVNSGAHTDMDFYSFMASSASLATTMARCAQAGMIHDGNLESLLGVLRIVGLEGENKMLTATGGVNTQKGLVFLLGIMAGVAGWLMGQGRVPVAKNVLEAAGQMVTGLVERELMGAASKRTEDLTAGEKLYLQYGITGIRGELAEGLPAVAEQALPSLKKALSQGLSINDALVQTLLVLMTCVDDTTVMHRHHPNKMRIWVRERATAVLAVGGMETAVGKKMCQELDAEFIAHNVSPGGVADLLAVSWFLYGLEVANI